ncbi:hypothetical protein [Mucilaginibacter sp. PAMB04168]|uniref:hypothetical protein n=1 Tax=Mucilaginibacter sp. PAMB04168 TaxID=3138567 RepID=UPI0031F6E298
MIRASALYIAIIIALVMAVICSSLITAAYFYRLQYQRTFRFQALQNNLVSAENLLLESTGDFQEVQKRTLFGLANDTVMLQRQPWGVYEVGVARAFIQADTLSRVFSMGHGLDSAKWSALYIIDEDRNISVSGKTSITGTAYLPKAGIKEAYINSQAYQGDKRLVAGEKRNSSRTLPALNGLLLANLEHYLSQTGQANSGVSQLQDSINRSFLQPTLTLNLGKQVYTLHQRLSGNVILHSDTTLIIDSTARLENVLVFAKAIVVRSGFRGACQLFATDSLRIEQHCQFNYPSTIGVMNFDLEARGQRKLSLGQHSTVGGILLTYERAKNELLPVLDLGKGTTITGQVYAQGLLNYQDGTAIQGSVHASRFLYQTAHTRYENYLINIRLDAQALSRNYLTSELLPVSKPNRKLMQWLN